MSAESPSPFTKPIAGMRIVPFVPSIPRPTEEQVERFPAEAQELLDRAWAAQEALPETSKYYLNWVDSRHFLIAGGTGAGLGGCLATSLVYQLASLGSVTIVSRDLKKSVEYEMGAAMQRRAEEAGLADRFNWINSGIADEGERFEEIVNALRRVGADRVIYVNAVAAAHSGMLPGYPPIFVKDVDEEGLFQWELRPLQERAIESTKYFMGALSVSFADALENAGIQVVATAYSDWRGSLDALSRNPENPEYGRQGPYSTSLYLPKRIIRRATAEAYRSGRVVLDAFLPVMKTRALFLIPGGRLMFMVYSRLMKKSGVRRIEIPELASAVLDKIGRTLQGEDENPFPRLDTHEIELDLWFYEVLMRLNNDENSEFYYRKWIEAD